MQNLLCVESLSSDFPYKDIDPTRAATVVPVLASEEIAPGIHQVAELNDRFKFTHSHVIALCHEVGMDSDQVQALSMGIEIFEGMCVVASPEFQPGVLEDDVEMIGDSIADVLLAANYEAISKMPNTMQMIGEVAYRRGNKYISSAVGGAALMLTMVTPSLPNAKRLE